MRFDGPRKIGSAVSALLVVPAAIAAGFQGAMVGSGLLGRLVPNWALLGGWVGFLVASGLVEGLGALIGLVLVALVQLMYSRATRRDGVRRR